MMPIDTAQPSHPRLLTFSSMLMEGRSASAYLAQGRGITYAH